MPANQSAPLLSVVATARNDNHGGNLLGRMQLFVNGVIEQCERHEIDAELVLVDWNPPDDKPHLAHALTWPSQPGRCRVRVIEVPPGVHARFAHSAALPLFQMIAKNVGIRRARGKFVLATNIDILFPDPVFQFIKSERLRPGHVYRVNRFDVPESVPSDCSLDEQLEFCRQNVIRKHFFEGSFDCRTRKWSSWRENVKTLRGHWRNIPRRIRHRTRLAFIRWRSNAVNRTRHTWNCTVRRGYNITRNYSGHYYRLGRGRLRGYANRTRNFCRHNYNMHVHPLKRACQREGRRIAVSTRRWVRLLQRLRGWPFWRLLISGPILLCVYVIWTTYRIVRACLRAFTRVLAKILGVDLFQEARDYCRTNLFVNGLSLRWVYFLERIRLNVRYHAMTARDRLPAWLDQSALIPRRNNLPGREDRIRGVQQRLERLKTMPIDERVRRFTDLQVRRCTERKLAWIEHCHAQETLRRERRLTVQRKREEERIRSENAKLERLQQQELARLERERQQELADKQRCDSMDLNAVSSGVPQLQLGGPSGHASQTGDYRSASIDPHCSVAEEHQSQPVYHSHAGAENSNGAKQTVSGGRANRNGKLTLQWPFLHTNGCGDFTMLAREDWEALRAYPEFEMYSMHIDSLFLVAGAHHGLKQHVLGNRAPIYHIEHGVGSGWTPEGEEKLKKRLAMARIPQLAHDAFMDYDRTMAQMGQAVMFNGPNWGLGDVELPEIQVN